MTCGYRQADPGKRPFRSSERPGGPQRTGKPPITSVVLTLRGPKHHEPARPPCPQSSGTCRQGLAGSRGPRARREQPVVSLARSGVAAQTGHRDSDPARVAESCSQRSHRGRCADARLDGIGWGHPLSGTKEMWMAPFVLGLAQKWQIGDWMGPPTLRYQGNWMALFVPKEMWMAPFVPKEMWMAPFVPRKCG